jgi:hypothetical protein
LQENEEPKKIVIAINKWTSDTSIFTVARSMPTPRCGDLLWSRVALNPSQVIQRSNLSVTYIFLISKSRCEESPQLESLTPYTIEYKQNQSNDGNRNAHKSTTQ